MREIPDMAKDKNSVEKYLAGLPQGRREPMRSLRQVIIDNLPKGFEEVMQGMPSYVVPLSTFPDGYHCTPGTPLPFLSIASQKNCIVLYHFGMYADKALMNWFVKEYPKHVSTKLDMGKSCVRFKKVDQLPLNLIGQLAAKRTVDQWVECYKSVLAK